MDCAYITAASDGSCPLSVLDLPCLNTVMYSCEHVFALGKCVSMTHRLQVPL